ncbi:MAG TPA: Co2+/Mg2+ efflux protein ApaG [Bacteroidota bacterium]|nr:Co2+/Mg2+ efflux protein ApaG [Bacteroidota bacterium]
MNSYTATTDNIVVTVRPVYLDGQSSQIEKKFVFAYFIRIENRSGESVQLLRRHWYIASGDGDVQEVEGEGVVGRQPVIPPGGAHEYNSFCILRTFEGSMEGTYLMEREGGEQFNVTIPRFALRAAAN